MAERLEVKTDDGRVLEVLTGGDPDGLPWLFHSGSPSAAVRVEEILTDLRRLAGR